MRTRLLRRTPAAARLPRWARAVAYALVAVSGAAGVTGAGPTTASATSGSGTTSSATTLPAFAGRVPVSTTQVVRSVRTNRWCGRVYCTKTQAWEKVDGRWRLARLADGRTAVFRSTIGPNGFAAEGKRRQGDGKTPSGIYKIKTTFSTTATNPGTTMPWHRRLPTSNVTDYDGPRYNVWIEESWRRDGDRPSMRWGFWVNYNHARFPGDPGPMAVQGKGSGIFYHTSRPGQEWVPTEGCTQLGDPAAMRWVVLWLRPEANPRVANNV